VGTSLMDSSRLKAKAGWGELIPRAEAPFALSLSPPAAINARAAATSSAVQSKLALFTPVVLLLSLSLGWKCTLSSRTTSGGFETMAVWKRAWKRFPDDETTLACPRKSGPDDDDVPLF